MEVEGPWLPKEASQSVPPGGEKAPWKSNMPDEEEGVQSTHVDAAISKISAASLGFSCDFADCTGQCKEYRIADKKCALLNHPLNDELPKQAF